MWNYFNWQFLRVSRVALLHVVKHCWVAQAAWRRIKGVEVNLNAFEISALDGDEWRTSPSDCFILPQRRYRLESRLNGFQSRLNMVVKQRNPSYTTNWTPLYHQLNPPIPPPEPPYTTTWTPLYHQLNPPIPPTEPPYTTNWTPLYHQLNPPIPPTEPPLSNP
jgi:hypothetical protein